MKKRKLTFVGDFETTVYDGQKETLVWASALVEMGSEDVKVFHSIDETYGYLESLNQDMVLYYHNLKFDGSFWLHWLLSVKHFRQSYTGELKKGEAVSWLSAKDMENESIRYNISAQNRWYTFTIKTAKGKTIEMRDSLKLLPFSLKRIGKAFQTKHQKLDMEYTGYRFPGCEITPEEQAYIANDVLVIKEALEIMFREGHDGLTIGACCLKEFKSEYDNREWEAKFPDLTEVPCEAGMDAENVDRYVRNAYKGGWCYLVPAKACKVYKRGITADVNSLYPSVMSGESGNLYPVGHPTFFHGPLLPKQCEHWRSEQIFWYVRLRTRFYIKEGMLPTIQIKGNRYYPSTQWLKTSDVWNRKTGGYTREYIDSDGIRRPAIVELTLSCVDYDLFLEHYRLEDTEILDGVVFQAQKGMFDRYMSKYKKIKMESKGAKRELAKLFLNNLYGKMGANSDSSFKVGVVDDETQALKYITVEEHAKKPGYIPIGAAITSYARDFTIRHAQKNYYGDDRPGFIYADTDSIHCDLNAGDLIDIKVHPTEFLCWKLESTWNEGFFVRQKTYIEHIIENDLEPVEPYYGVRCAGMSEHCKDLFKMTLDKGFDFNSLPEPERLKYSAKEQLFLSKKRTISDFNVGLTVPGGLKARNISGGVLLCEQDYRMLPQITVRDWKEESTREPDGYLNMQTVL